MEAPLHKVCGTRHWSSQPCPATKSTAARKDVPGQVRMTPARAPQPEPQDRIGGLGDDPQVVSLAAGTQAPPVDAYPVAKASKAKPVPAQSAKPDGDVSRPSRGGGTPAVIIHPRVNDLSPAGLAAIAEGIAAEAPRKRGRPRLANPKSPRAAYQRDLMRKRYAEKKKQQSEDQK